MRRLILIALLLGLGLSTAQAGPGGRWGDGPRLARDEHSARMLSRDQAAARARRATGGRVLGVRPRKGDGEPVYRVKVLRPGGRVQEIWVDRRTGDLLD